MPSAASLAARRGQGPDASRPARDEAPARVLVEWRVHLAQREPAKARVAVGLVAAAALVALVAFAHPLAPLLTAVALLASVSEFLFPLHYRLTTAGIERHHVFSHTSLSWEEARRCVTEGDSIRVSPLPAPSFRDAYRGISLRLPRDEETRAQVLETLGNSGCGM